MSASSKNLSGLEMFFHDEKRLWRRLHSNFKEVYCRYTFGHLPRSQTSYLVWSSPVNPSHQFSPSFLLLLSLVPNQTRRGRGDPTERGILAVLSLPHLGKEGERKEKGCKEGTTRSGASLWGPLGNEEGGKKVSQPPFRRWRRRSKTILSSGHLSLSFSPIRDS